MNIASIDIGTNTIILLIAQIDLAEHRIKAIFNDQKIPRIGQGLKPGYPMSTAKEQLLYSILGSYKEIAENYNCEKILLTATHAFRIASNSKDIVKKIKRHLNLIIRIVSSEDEARLTFFGCTSEIKSGKNIAVIDIGGGSTEISFGSSKKLNSCRSIPIGVVSMSEEYFFHDRLSKDEVLACRSAISCELLKLGKFEDKIAEFIGVAGTPTTLAAIKKRLKIYDEESIEGETLLKSDIEYFTDQLSHLSPQEIKNKFTSVVAGREDLILAGAILLSEIMEYLKADQITVSSKGVRYGAIYDFLRRLN